MDHYRWEVYVPPAQRVRGYQRAIDLGCDAVLTLCQPVAAGQQAFEPPEEQFNGPALFVDLAKSPHRVHNGIEQAEENHGSIIGGVELAPWIEFARGFGPTRVESGEDFPEPLQQLESLKAGNIG